MAPPPHHRRYPLVDGLRAIAVLTVLIGHAAFLSGQLNDSLTGRLFANTNIGVTIFFLISGFLLYRPFIAHRAGQAQPPKIADYAKRRLLRIYPAYWLVLTVLVIVPGLVGVYNGQWLGQYTLLGNLPIAGGDGCSTAILGCGLAQTWSLGVELTFYAALPVYALLADRLARSQIVSVSTRRELLLLAVLSAISVVATYVAGSRGPQTWLGATLAGYMLWFSLGMAAALVTVRFDPDAQRKGWLSFLVERPGVLWIVAIAGYVALCLSIPPTPFLLGAEDHLVVQLSFGVVSVLLLLSAIFAGETSVVHRLLSNPVIAWLGLVSYGIFLWHYVFALELGSRGNAFWVVLGGTLAGSVICAALSYYLVERPALRLKYRRLRRPTPST